MTKFTTGALCQLTRCFGTVAESMEAAELEKRDAPWGPFVDYIYCLFYVPGKTSFHQFLFYHIAAIISSCVKGIQGKKQPCVKTAHRAINVVKMK